jgi:macrolide transport system ATP-binding/permease protein
VNPGRDRPVEVSSGLPITRLPGSVLAVFAQAVPIPDDWLIQTIVHNLFSSMDCPDWMAACSARRMFQDLRYAIRALWRKPGFALTAILSIALGIGANALIFSQVHGMLLRPLPVPHASEVVTLRSRTPNGTFGSISWPDYLDFRDRDQSFKGVVAYEHIAIGYAPDAATQSTLKTGMLVSGNFFRVLETEPQLGRGFLPDEDRIPGRDAVAVLGYDFWKSEFGGDRSVIGRQIRLGGIEFNVVGVAPEAFTEIDQFVRPAFFLPAAMGPKIASKSELLTDRSARVFTVKARLRPGVSVPAAGAEVAALAAYLERSNPITNRVFGAVVRTEIQTHLDLSPGIPIISGLLFSVVAVLLAIACANVANLMLARGRSRAREIAVRLALGGSRARLIRQLMTESLVIALAGGALGLMIVTMFLEATSNIQVPGEIPIQLNFQLNQWVLWFTIAVSAGCALFFGLAPALQATDADLVPALKTGEADQARKRWFGRSAMVAIQVAGSLMLLVTSAQLFRGIARDIADDPGFRRDHILLMTFDPSMIRYTPAQTDSFYQTLADSARAVPGVASVGLASTIPLSTSLTFETVVPEGYQFPRGQESINAWSSNVDEDFFETLGVRIVQGRGILATDRANTTPVAVVNEVFAKRYLNGNPIGRRLRVGAEWIEVVGVSATGRYFTGTAIEPQAEALFRSYRQHAAPKMTLIVHANGDPVQLAAPLRDMMRSIDANVPVFGVRTMSDLFEQRTVILLHVISRVVGVFGLIGLALALVGLYAVVAWQVAGRTREIGIRMAIGADRLEVVKMILIQAGRMSITGVAIGLALSFAATRVLNKALPPLDPWLFVAVPLALLLTTLLAAAIPSRRAARVDPMVALRQD